MNTLLHENKHTLKLAFPIIVSNLGQMLLGLTDTVMIGRVGTVELAAVALMNTLVHLFMVLGIGWAIAVSIQVSHAHGSSHATGKRIALAHGFILSILLGIVVWIGMKCSMPLFSHLKQPVDVLQVMPEYLFWIAPSIAFMMPTMVLKSYAEAVNRPWGVFAIQLAGVALNVLLNAALIFGMWGFPEMGLAGAGLATFISRVLTLLGLICYLHGYFPDARLTGNRLYWKECKTLMILATPITSQMLMEFGAFATSAIFIGQLGSLPMAAHQIALTCAATTYMIPMGISNAVGIRVGHSLGSGSITRCRHIVMGAQSLTLFIMGLFAIFYLTLGEHIARVFSHEPDLIALTVSLLSITGIFQLFDGVQIVSVGALRAMKDVAVPTAFCFIGYWLVAIPLGYGLGFGLKRGVTGFWMGLAAGLLMAACLMSVRLALLLRRNQRTL
ncbi:MATE family efflux transporter [Kiritimatiellota bacterium B12222]|nr:MATE family efflux transporter [Kiritimatiellota bacterium B12222]